MARIKMKPAGQALVAVVIVTIVSLIAWKTGLLESHRASGPSTVVAPISLAQMRDGGAVTPALANFRATPPSRTAIAAGSNVQDIRMLMFAWNSQCGIHFANGGKVTTVGSLMAERGIRLTLARQDDTSQMQNALIACARQLHGGAPDCTEGVHYVAIMGDGGAMFLTSLNAQLRALGDNYRAEIIGSAGFSRGEDKFMGPPAWQSNPQAAKGGLVAGVIRDGDWNIAMHWASLNGVPFNPDDRTYDPDAMNWLSTSTYLEPVERYNNRTSDCETRPVVRNGRRTGASQRVCIQGVVTWTPGDVNVVHGRGGLVSLLSTRENATQMPNAIIGIRAWNRGHRDVVTKFIEAIGLGGQAVLADEANLRIASRISDEVYQEQGADQLYWMRYYLGVEERDSQGNRVFLGGSRVNTLGDMMELFGLNEGSTNAFSATYTTFGDVTRRFYPDQLPTFDAFDTVSDTSYVRAAHDRAVAAYGQQTEQVQRVAFNEAAAQNAPVVAQRSWAITFVTGSAEVAPEAQTVLNELGRTLTISANTFVEINGHTDNVGDPALNQSLSERRAASVRTWLQTNFGRNTFPDARLRTQGFGQSQPVQPNATEQGRAANRRVEIILRANNA